MSAKKKRTLFICWSGTRGQKVAQALEKAIKALGTDLQPFCSPGIEKGSLWFDQLRGKLEVADFAIVCVTPESADSTWMHFEAGAVTAKMTAKLTADTRPRLYPFLFRMAGQSLTGPLAQFQATTATEDDTIRMIDGMLGEVWRKGHRKKAASQWWLDLQNELRLAEDRPLEEILPDLESLFRRKTFDEALDDCVNQSWPSRWSGARDAHQQLRRKVAEVVQQCRPYARELLQHLIQAVDSYAMSLELLLKPARFEFTEQGKRNVPSPLLTACERRREEIKRLLSGLADPKQTPVFEQAPKFRSLETFAEKKALVHQFEAWLRQPKEDRDEDWRMAKAAKDPNAGNSTWDFDRIAFYIIHEQPRKAPSLENAVEWLRREIETTRAQEKTASHMPLTYSLGPLRQSILERQSRQSDQGRIELLKEVRNHLSEAIALGKRREKQQRSKKVLGGEKSRLRLAAEGLVELLEESIRPRPTRTSGGSRHKGRKFRRSQSRPSAGSL